MTRRRSFKEASIGACTLVSSRRPLLRHCRVSLATMRPRPAERPFVWREPCDRSVATMDSTARNRPNRRVYRPLGPCALLLGIAGAAAGITVLPAAAQAASRSEVARNRPNRRVYRPLGPCALLLGIAGAAAGITVLPAAAQAASRSEVAVGHTIAGRAARPLASSVCSKVSAASVSAVVGYTLPAPSSSSFNLKASAKTDGVSGYRDDLRVRLRDEHRRSLEGCHPRSRGHLEAVDARRGGEGDRPVGVRDEQVQGDFYPVLGSRPLRGL